MPSESHEPPPLELTIVVEPFGPPKVTNTGRPPPPPADAPGNPVTGLALATAAAALVFAALTWWTAWG